MCFNHSSGSALTPGMWFMDSHSPLLIYSQAFCGVAMETIGLRRLCREPSSADRCRHRGHSLIVPGQMCSCPSWSRSSALALLLSEITAAPPSAGLLLVNTPPLKPTGDILRTVRGAIIVKNGKKNLNQYAQARTPLRTCSDAGQARPARPPHPLWGPATCVSQAAVTHRRRRPLLTLRQDGAS